MKIYWKKFWRLFRAKRDELVIEVKPMTEEMKKVLLEAVSQLIKDLIKKYQ